MELILRYGGDILWAIAMGLMANVSRAGFQRIPSGTPTPAPWNFSGGGGPRTARGLALVFTPTIAFFVGAGLLTAAWTHAGADPTAVMIFGARALIASLFALVHLTHVRGALIVLGGKGKLKP